MTEKTENPPNKKPVDNKLINPKTGRRYKTGGRKKGTKNNPKIAIIREMKKQELANIKEILDENTSPLAMLLRTLNDTEVDLKLRIDAAGRALPYIHGKRPNLTEISGRDGKPIEFSSASAREQLQSLLFTDNKEPALEYKEGITIDQLMPVIPQEELDKIARAEELRALTTPLEDDE